MGSGASGVAAANSGWRPRGLTDPMDLLDDDAGGTTLITTQVTRHGLITS
jgi:hypothetical protein